MGKKGKVGKGRKDKFYHLAKETGYRARSAFKLIQLNRKFGFLQNSRALIDLCAAPGGWLQVASKFMPVSSIIVGVDLVPIRAIPRVTTLIEDITTEKCRQSLKKELQTWKADCVLNDGAPNVGSAWVQDAFTQATLTLSAFKLACEFLKEGGWFITKVFRSKDYQPLMWVFQQLFKNVHATKPQASRNESAEIFVVCQGFLAPDKIDPKLLDTKYIFSEVEAEPNTNKLNLIHPEKISKHAEGYSEGDYTLFHKAPVSEYILGKDKHFDILASCHQLEFDDDKFLNHPETTEEIKLCCQDIKVLGKKEIKSLLRWRSRIRKDLKIGEENQEQAEIVEKVEEEEDEDEEIVIEREIQEVKLTAAQEQKKNKKRILEQRRKLRERMSEKGGHSKDSTDITADQEIFNLSTMKSKQELEKVEQIDLDDLDDEQDEDKDDDEDGGEEDGEEESEGDSNEEESDEEMEDEIKGMDIEEANEDEQDLEGNPLILDMEPKPDVKSKTDLWFSKDIFQGLETEADEDVEISQSIETYQQTGGVVLDEKNKSKEKESKSVKTNDDDDDDDDDDDTDSDDTSDSDSEDEKQRSHKKTATATATAAPSNNNKDGFEVVPQQSHSMLKRLTPEGLAVGSQMAFSKKRKRDIIDGSFHRYTFNDTDLPSWFLNDEKKHIQRHLPVTREEAQQYKDHLKEINARPIKKVAEAKARKKYKTMQRMEKARKKSEVICDAADVSDKEKMSQIKHIYKKAGLLGKKKEAPTFVRAKKSTASKRPTRPAGVTGFYKMVDPRMKKEVRAQKRKEKKGKKGKKR